MFESTLSFIKENIALFDILFFIFVFYFAFQCFAKGFFLFLMRQTIIVMSRHIEYDFKNDIFLKYQQLNLAFGSSRRR